ncbi:conserved membrane hypothetical protein [Tenacibaculum amylolyticum]
MNYLDLFVQILTGVLSFFFYFKNKTKFLLLLTILTVLTGIVESFGEYTVLSGKSSFFLYHIFSLIQFSIIFMIYVFLIKDSFFKKVFSFLHFLFFCFWGVIFFKGELFFYLIIFGAFNTSFYVLIYLRSILMSDKILNYKELLPFWVSVGFLVFHLPSIPFFTLFGQMQNRGLFFILNILVILMNLFIIYGLLCSKKEEKYL